MERVYKSLEDFVAKQFQLIEKERDAEVEETRAIREGLPPKELEKLGECLLRLRVKAVHTGLGGRFIIKLERGKHYKEESPPLPAHRFTPGDIVTLVPSNKAISTGVGVGDEGGKIGGAESVGGVVYRVTPNSVTVALSSKSSEGEAAHFHDEVVDKNVTVNLMRMANDVTYKRMKKALTVLSTGRVQQRAAGTVGTAGRPSRLRDILFGISQPAFSRLRPIEGTEGEFFIPFNKGLNAPQKEAIAFALSANDLALIHGPPGTGKTTTVVELILQAVMRGQRVLATAPSNVAVDNMAEKLANFAHAAGAKIIRVGHPARLLPSVLEYSLDARLKHADETELVNDVRKEILQLQQSLQKSTAKGERSKAQRQLRELRKELRIREKKAVAEMIGKSNIVLATNTGCDDKNLFDANDFDMVVIDEAAQALEAACWIPIFKGSKLILAGDHQQLPPTIMSGEAAKEGLSTTLFERMIKMYSETVTRKLVIQYRMNETIMQWSSKELYEGDLVADDSVKHHLLKDLPKVKTTPETSHPMILIDTSGCGLNEQLVEETKEGIKLPAWIEGSKANDGEVDIVLRHVLALLKAGLKGEEIGVISPYNAQVDRLRAKLRENQANTEHSSELAKIEISTVDGFQGREKEAIVISMVRSNDAGNVGFLSENRRMNVAVTRAKRHVAVVCDTETVANHPFLDRMIKYFEENAEYWSAHQYTEDAAGGEEYLGEGDRGKLNAEKGEKQKEQRQERRVEKEEREKEEVQKKAEQEKENEKMEKELEAQIKEFLEDEERKELLFPSSLTSFQRMLVHKICEGRPVKHESRGRKGNRAVCLIKVKDDDEPEAPKKEEETIDEEGIDEENGDVKNEENVDGEEQTQTKKKKKKGRRNRNKRIQEGSCEEEEEQTEKEKERNNTQLKGNKQEETPKNGGKQPNQQTTTTPAASTKKSAAGGGGKDDLASIREMQRQKFMQEKNREKKETEKEMLEIQGRMMTGGGRGKKKKKGKGGGGGGGGQPTTAQKGTSTNNKPQQQQQPDVLNYNSSKCPHGGCGAGVSLLGKICPFCKLKFCLSHSLPEVHGCGDEAKKKARADWLNAKTKPDGTARTSAAPKPATGEKRDLLAKQLQKKIDKVGHKGKKTPEGGGSGAGRGRGRGK